MQDLLTTVNKPEWPATELLLSLLGKLLVRLPVTSFLWASHTVSDLLSVLRYLNVNYRGRILEKLVVPQLIKNFPKFYVTSTNITVS